MKKMYKYHNKQSISDIIDLNKFANNAHRTSAEIIDHCHSIANKRYLKLSQTIYDKSYDLLKLLEEHIDNPFVFLKNFYISKDKNENGNPYFITFIFNNPDAGICIVVDCLENKYRYTYYPYDSTGLLGYVRETCDEYINFYENYVDINSAYRAYLYIRCYLIDEDRKKTLSIDESKTTTDNAFVSLPESEIRKILFVNSYESSLDPGGVNVHIFKKWYEEIKRFLFSYYLRRNLAQCESDTGIITLIAKEFWYNYLGNSRKNPDFVKEYFWATISEETGADIENFLDFKNLVDYDKARKKMQQRSIFCELYSRNICYYFLPYNYES